MIDDMSDVNGSLSFLPFTKYSNNNIRFEAEIRPSGITAPCFEHIKQSNENLQG